MLSIVRGLVSKNIRRYKEDGFCLDLSYITPRIIAMGYPSEGKEALYRNNISTVLDFLTKHHQGHYKVFNLCSERSYDPIKLGGNVERIPVDEHNPAPTNIILHFCKCANDWMQSNSRNVLVIHCSTGKGRTGMMICAFLLYTKAFPSPHSAIQHFSEQRTKDGKDILIPSQRRYIFYFHDHINKGPKILTSIQLLKICFFSKLKFKDLIVTIFSNGGNGDYPLKRISSSSCGPPNNSTGKEGENTTLNFHDVWIVGDIKLDCHNNETQLCSFWFNTGFVRGTSFSITSLSELDKPCGLDEDTQIHLHFSSKETSCKDSDASAISDIKFIEQLTKQLSSVINVATQVEYGAL